MHDWTNNQMGSHGFDAVCVASRQNMCCIIYIDVVMRCGNRLMQVNCDT